MGKYSTGTLQLSPHLEVVFHNEELQSMWQSVWQGRYSMRSSGTMSKRVMKNTNKFEVVAGGRRAAGVSWRILAYPSVSQRILVYSNVS